ncbi:MAG: hypothetical protein WBE72_25755 [Terracidiphilus sp.]
MAYANVPLFDLKTYTPRKFPPGGRVLPKPPETGNPYYAYRLDGVGRPVHMAYSRLVNGLVLRGFYQYGADEVEYVEFCLQTEVVSDYARMALRNGLPATYQHVEIDGHGSHPSGQKGKDAVATITGNSFLYWIQVEEYEAADNRIVRGRAMFEGKKLAPQLSTLEYSYSDEGRLARVVRVNEDGSRFTEFAARSKISMKELATRLSEKIATRTIEALKGAGFDSPLQAVELSYRSGTEYVPGVIPATQRDPISNLGLVLAIDPSRWIALNREDFEPEMADFTERLHEAEQRNLGTKMLRQAALLVAKLAPGTRMTAGCFVAYAIDWEFEGQDLRAILKECGASGETFKRLKEMGWLE